MKSKLFISLLSIVCNAFAETENRSEAKHVMFVIAAQEDQALIAATKNNTFSYDPAKRPIVNMLSTKKQLSEIYQGDLKNMRLIEIDYVMISDESSRKVMIEYLLDITPALIFITGTKSDNKVVDALIAQLNQTSPKHLAVAL